MPTALVIGRLIYIGEENLQCFGDRMIDTVEKTHHTFFGKRVLYLLLRYAVCLTLPGGSRQSCGVSPFRMCGEDFIGVNPTTVRFLVCENAVLRGRRPIHQLIGKIGTLVKIVDTEHMCHITRYGNKLLRCYITGQRADDSCPRIFFRAAVCGVKHGSIRECGFVVIKKLLCNAVTIQGKHGA